VTLEGNPWFIVKDLPEVLGWTLHNLNYHLKTNIDLDEKRLLSKTGSSHTTRCLFVGNAGRLTVVSESGLYKLIMRSDKPQAKAFQDWVTKEVLPSIRKTGSFVTGQPNTPKEY
jgi:prophage antirepressor-like protein